MNDQRMKSESPIEELPSPEADGETTSRGTWSNKVEFFLSLLGFAIGFGNIWRFPYLCYKNGGAVFLIPYILMLFLVGIPMVLTEVAIGQYISLGPNKLFPKMAPLLSGLGWGMIMLNIFSAIYFNIIICWSIYYAVASFSSALPWSHCNNEFNSPECYSENTAAICKNSSLFFYNKTCVTVEQYCGVAELEAYNQTHCQQPIEGALSASSVIPRISPSEDFFLNGMLGVKSKNWDDFGGLQWELVGYLALAWLIVWTCLCKGIKSLGKVVYLTSTFPFIILIVLFIRGITLEGAYNGIEFYILKPNITKLLDVEVWSNAAVQILFSNGSSVGVLLTLASYNKFNNKFIRHVVTVSLSNSCTSIFTGFVIFSILGFLANELGVPVNDVASSGSGLVFVVYPAGLALLPLPHLWSVLFFLMMIIVGLGTQLSKVESLSTALLDQFESLRPKKPLVVALICFAMFLLGLTFCLEGGILMLELFFWYAMNLSFLVMAFTQVFGVHYIYGHKNFLRNIKEMGINLSFQSRCYWRITCLVTSPVSLAILTFMAIYFFEPVAWGGYVFPKRVQTLGWFLCASSIILIPLGALYALCRTKRLKDLVKPLPDFCPAAGRELKRVQATSLEYSGIHASKDSMVEMTHL